MQIARPNTILDQIVREVLRHLLRQRRHEHPLALRFALSNLSQQVVDLTLGGPQIDNRVDQTRWANDLLDDATTLAGLEGAGGCRDEDALPNLGQKFGKLERAIVER